MRAKMINLHPRDYEVHTTSSKRMQMANDLLGSMLCGIFSNPDLTKEISNQKDTDSINGLIDMALQMVDMLIDKERRS